MPEKLRHRPRKIHSRGGRADVLPWGQSPTRNAHACAVADGRRNNASQQFLAQR